MLYNKLFPLVKLVDKGRAQKAKDIDQCMFYFFTSMGWCVDGGRSQHLKVSSIMVFWELGPSQTFLRSGSGSGSGTHSF